MKATRKIEVTLVLDEEEAEWLLATLEGRDRENRPYSADEKLTLRNRFTDELKITLGHEY